MIWNSRQHSMWKPVTLRVSVSARRVRRPRRAAAGSRLMLYTESRLPEGRFRVRSSAAGVKPMRTVSGTTT
jgi:hypothetical protein